jgi:hypothetical protein
MNAKCKSIFRSSTFTFSIHHLIFIILTLYNTKKIDKILKQNDQLFFRFPASSVMATTNRSRSLGEV